MTSPAASAGFSPLAGVTPQSLAVLAAANRAGASFSGAMLPPPPKPSAAAPAALAPPPAAASVSTQGATPVKPEALAETKGSARAEPKPGSAGDAATAAAAAAGAAGASAVVQAAVAALHGSPSGYNCSSACDPPLSLRSSANGCVPRSQQHTPVDSGSVSQQAGDAAKQAGSCQAAGQPSMAVDTPRLEERQVASPETTSTSHHGKVSLAPYTLFARCSALSAPCRACYRCRSPQHEFKLRCYCVWVGKDYGLQLAVFCHHRDSNP